MTVERNNMDIDAADVINRLTMELTQAVQARIIAESQAEAAYQKLSELEEENGS